MRRLAVLATLLVSLIVGSASSAGLSPIVTHADTCTTPTGGVCPT
jgi:hypothetical protein